MNNNRRLLSVLQNVYHSSLRHKATPAAAVKPFFYQDILQAEGPHDTPFKKLTGRFQINMDHNILEEINNFLESWF